MSCHIGPCLDREASPPPVAARRERELSLVSATVVEAVDRSRDRQTYVASKIREGRAVLFSKRPLSLQCITTPHCCLRKGCLTVSSRSQLKLSQPADWNHLSHTHTHTFALPCTGHTHIHPDADTCCSQNKWMNEWIITTNFTVLDSSWIKPGRYFKIKVKGMRLQYLKPTILQWSLPYKRGNLLKWSAIFTSNPQMLTHTSHTKLLHRHTHTQRGLLPQNDKLNIWEWWYHSARPHYHSLKHKCSFKDSKSHLI